MNIEIPTAVVMAFSWLSFIGLSSKELAAQTQDKTLNSTPFIVMSYNVENLFDTQHDQGKDDAEFLPNGMMEWDEKKYNSKLGNIAKVISAVGQKHWPSLIGLVEVENERTMKDLLARTTLGQKGYQFTISNSPDHRGIDVALLYLGDRFKLISKNEYQVQFSTNARKRSRNILHVTGQLQNKQLLDVFVCHFPSRREGVRQTDPDRHDVSRLLKSKCDELLRKRPDANIIIMGDFNSTPSERPITNTLDANINLPKPAHADASKLYNLFGYPRKLTPPGSLVHQRKWEQYDYIIVSGQLLKPFKGGELRYIRPSARNAGLDMLLTKARTVTGQAPKRTYRGTHYMGGYSDHLPVVANFEFK